VLRSAADPALLDTYDHERRGAVRLRAEQAGREMRTRDWTAM
jgi:hypothetical protein